MTNDRCAVSAAAAVAKAAAECECEWPRDRVKSCRRRRRRWRWRRITNDRLATRTDPPACNAAARRSGTAGGDPSIAIEPGRMEKVLVGAAAPSRRPVGRPPASLAVHAIRSRRSRYTTMHHARRSSGEDFAAGRDLAKAAFFEPESASRRARRAARVSGANGVGTTVQAMFSNVNINYKTTVLQSDNVQHDVHKGWEFPLTTLVRGES